MRCSVTVSYVVFGNVQHAIKMLIFVVNKYAQDTRKLSLNDPRVARELILTSSCGNQDIAKHKQQLIDLFDNH